MLGIMLVTIWASLTIAYLLRQQLRGELSGRVHSLPPLPWRGAQPEQRSGRWQDRAA